MQEPHIEGVANHDDPESCAAGREARREALTGAGMGWVMSCEIHFSGRRRRHPRRKATRTAATSQVAGRPAQSKTPRTCRNLMRENREVRESPAAWRSGPQWEGRRP